MFSTQDDNSGGYFQESKVLLSLIFALSQPYPTNSSPPFRPPEAVDIARSEAYLLRRISQVTPESLVEAMGLAELACCPILTGEITSDSSTVSGRNQRWLRGQIFPINPSL